MKPRRTRKELPEDYPTQEISRTLEDFGRLELSARFFEEDEGDGNENYYELGMMS